MDDIYLIRKRFNEFYIKLLGANVVLVVGLLTFALLFSACLIFVNEQFLSTPKVAQFLPRDRHDDYAFLTLNAKQASAASAGHRMVFIGTAAMREGLMPPGEIGRSLESRYGVPFDVVNFMSGGQSALEAAALLHEVQGQKPAIVVLGVSPSRMAASPAELQKLVDQPRLGFINDGFLDEARALGLSTKPDGGLQNLSYFWKHRQFFSIRAVSYLRNLIFQNAPQNDVHMYLEKGQQSSERWDSDANVLRARIASYAANFQTNIASYTRLMHNARNANPRIEFVLFDIPLNPRTIEDIMGTSFYKGHKANMARYCEEQKCLYLNANEMLALSASDFQDWSHIASTSAQRKITEALLAGSSPLLESWLSAAKVAAQGESR